MRRAAVVLAVLLTVMVTVWMLTGPWPRAAIFGPIVLVGRAGMRKWSAEA